MTGALVTSIYSNLAANEANLELALNQHALEKTARNLSSGLRINDASDDPSGFAVASSLRTQTEGFAQASRNVQTATNLAIVVDAALASTTGILQRIRSIAVEAASSIDSDSDRANQQAEIDQLLLEINRISQNTNFNGVPLLDGSHAGFVAAQAASIDVTANSVLASAGPSAAPNAPSGYLVARTSFIDGALQPTIFFRVLQNVTASPAAQTVSVSDAAHIQPGSIFKIGGALVTVQSVNPSAGTITAVFSANVASGDVADITVNANLVNAVSAGTQIATLSGGPQPLYAGETLQVGYTAFPTNDVVVVQKVLGPNTFVATFNKPQSAGSGVFNFNGTFLPANFGPGTFTYSFGGAPTDGAPVGSTAYVVETSSSSFPPANGSTTQVVATGTVVGGSVNSESIAFSSQVPNYFGGWFEVLTALGFGSTPLLSTVDGTIKVQVVNTGVSIAAQETFYDTATQTSTTSPFLLAPNEQSLLFDGVSVTLGNFTAADVGTTSYVKVHQATAALTNPSNPSLNVLSGADEGDTVAFGLQATDTQTLRVSTVTVLASGGNDSTLAAQDTIGQVDFALQQIVTQRAQLGAYVVRFGIDSQNDDNASTELQAAESNIRDANVGAEATAFTREQVLVQVCTSVLAQANSLPQAFLKLFG